MTEQRDGASSTPSPRDAEAWLRFDDADDVGREEWLAIARVRVAMMARSSPDRR